MTPQSQSHILHCLSFVLKSRSKNAQAFFGYAAKGILVPVSKRMAGTLKAAIRKMVLESATEWDQAFSEVLFGSTDGPD